MAFFKTTKSQIFALMIAFAAGTSSGSSNRVLTTNEIRQQYASAMQTDSVLRALNARLSGGEINDTNFSDFENLIRLVDIGRQSGRPVPEEITEAINAFNLVNTSLERFEAEWASTRLKINEGQYSEAINTIKKSTSNGGIPGSLQQIKLFNQTNLKSHLPGISLTYVSNRIIRIEREMITSLAKVPKNEELAETLQYAIETLNKIAKDFSAK